MCKTFKPCRIINRQRWLTMHETVWENLLRNIYIYIYTYIFVHDYLTGEKLFSKQQQQQQQKKRKNSMKYFKYSVLDDDD